MTFRPDHKDKTYNNPKYELFVRSKPCLCCGKESICHHEQGLGIGLVGGGTAKKCSSLAALPLCVECHSKRHDKGYVTFWCNSIGLTQCNPHARFIADAMAMREVVKLLMEWIETGK